MTCNFTERISVRKANLGDIPQLVGLIGEYAVAGLMLPRSANELCVNIRDFNIVEQNEAVAGCGALSIYTSAIAEVRSLAVARSDARRGIGRMLMQAIETEARELGLQAVFALTRVPDFFLRLGYSQVERGALSLKTWKDCMHCPKLTSCDEVGVVKPLVEEAAETEAMRQTRVWWRDPNESRERNALYSLLRVAQ